MVFSTTEKLAIFDIFLKTQKNDLL